jgi:methylenetetrahydrofolate--tRNA-(uracil-5-)-methyltransferase
MKPEVAIIGGGLAGCELAWQLAEAKVPLCLFEMKPNNYSPAHLDSNLAELVCSNSLRSKENTSAVGLLKKEMLEANSLFMQTALKTQVPAGKALAVDRAKFSRNITKTLEESPYVQIFREEICSIREARLQQFSYVVLAAGPLASSSLVDSLLSEIGGQDLYFYDAIAPIVLTDSVDLNKAFWASRYQAKEKDYLNCPLDESEYANFCEALLEAEKVKPREFEKEMHFEGCLPIETMAERGYLTLAYGPLKPVGLTDPRTGKEPFAVVQLRAENNEKTMLNMVGFQTKLKYKEQHRVFRLIPGLKNAEFERLGSIHRNTFVKGPQVLTPQLEIQNLKGFFLAGQLTGVEGYVESAATGLWLGKYLAGKIQGKDVSLPPRETAMGALLSHVSRSDSQFQPSNVHFGLMPSLNVKAPKWKRKELYAQRAEKAWQDWLQKSDMNQ